MTLQVDTNHSASEADTASADPSLTGLSIGLLRPQIKLQFFLLFMICLTVAGAIAWAAFASVVEVTTGQGKVIPASKIQLIQNLEGGIVKEILISEGRKIKKGDLLFRIDPIVADSSLEEMREHMVSLEASVKRLQAILKSNPLTYSAQFSTKNPQLVTRNMAEFRAAQAEINAIKSGIEDQITQRKLEKQEAEAGLASVRSSLKIARQELGLQLKLEKDHATSQTEVLTAKSKVIELEGKVSQLQLSIPRFVAAINEGKNKLIEVESRSKSEAAAKLNDAAVKLNAMRGASKANVDRVKRANIRSPVDGVIKTLHANTIGQVIKPGEDIAEIVPLNDNLLVQAMIQPQDIAFLHPGQDVVIKITAYDFTLFGALKGKLARIGADSIVDEKGNAFFLVDIHANKSFLERDGIKLPIMPGMVAQVDIVTGDKTILNYLTKPMHRMVSNSFHER